ncbi:twin-arginine translocation signal domain-containing protein [Haloglomus litoreum]|uniref:twin-arginine translocation signal domain-containing protein n=1 Tax=Haloglomus litoreum TaxID=3034026 RepID=UPI0023E8440C|nr:twin-arginine translocation signal domain-containing protein [Haloglomus sp. DT116]
MDRRTFLSGVGAAGGAALAGCSNPLASPTRVESRRGITFGADIVGDDARSKEAWEPFEASMHDRYGSLGVYGDAGPDPEHGLEFGGGWTQPLDHEGGLESHHALVFHRFPGGEDGTAGGALWLWSAVDPTAADGATVERIEAAVDLPSNGASMGIYDPAQDYRSEDTDAYGVATPRMDVDGLSVSMALPAGRVGYDPEGTTVGEGGGYAPLWQGSHEGMVGLVATCMLAWPAEDGQTLQWSVAVETLGA